MKGPPQGAAPLGGNLMLASIMSLLSFVPFDLVAKASLLVCAAMFILDPFPPHSRLVSLLSCVVVAMLSRAHKQWQMGQVEQVEQELVLEELDGDDDDDNDYNKKVD